MTFWLFLIAGVLAFLWLAIHLTLGNRDIARPMLASDLDDVVRETQYLCWHFTTVSIACMGLFFTAAAIWNDSAMALAGTLLAAGFAISGIALVQQRGASHAEVPQGWLFAPIALCGLIGLWA